MRIKDFGNREAQVINTNRSKILNSLLSLSISRASATASTALALKAPKIGLQLGCLLTSEHNYITEHFKVKKLVGSPDKRRFTQILNQFDMFVGNEQ